MRRSTLIVPLGAILLAGCAESAAAPSADTASTPTSTSPISPTPVVEDPLVADQALVRSLYYDLTQAFNQGLDAAAAYDAAHNHPQTSYTTEECRDAFDETGYTDAYSLSAVPDVAAMAPDPGWALPDGRYAGVVPDGRTYIVPVTFDYSDPTLGIRDSFTNQLHVTVLDEAAYFFRPCELLP